jgi:hypothetical protein
MVGVQGNSGAGLCGNSKSPVYLATYGFCIASQERPRAPGVKHADNDW